MTVKTAVLLDQFAFVLTDHDEDEPVP